MPSSLVHVLKQVEKREGSAREATRKFDPLSYGEILAVSLILYAEKDECFEELLSKFVYGAYSDRKVTDNFYPLNIPASVELLVPRDEGVAMRRMLWLMRNISREALPGSKEAQDLLFTWARSRPLEEPKQIVVGIWPSIVPEITLGKWKMKRERMPMIIRMDLKSKKNNNSPRYASRASLGVLEQGLNISSGNARELEPELGDWFFGEKDIAFYSASGDSIFNIIEDVEDLGAMRYTIFENMEPVVLALSPSININYCPLNWELDELEG